MAVQVVSLLVLLVVNIVYTESFNESLLETIRKSSSQFATTVAAKELNCEGLIYRLSDDSYNDCIDDNSTSAIAPKLAIQFRWLSELFDKETRCYCALSFFQLMIPFNIYNNVSFCTEDSIFKCDDDCSNDISNQCIVRTVEMYPSLINDINITIIAAFSELSCEAIRDHREDICDILFQFTNENTTQATTEKDMVPPEILLVSALIGTVATLIVIIILIISAFCFINHRKRKIKNTIPNKAYPSGVNIANEHSSFQLQSSIYTQYTGISFEPHVLLRKDDLKITGELGQGAFGIVYKGCIQSTGTDVAIKTLKDTSSVEEIREFFSEADIMLEFNHPNVMAILGVCVDSTDGLPLIVLPYMVNGDLKAFLTSCRKDNCVEVLPEILSQQRLKLICQDIANGMAYLASIKFVHRDLAARNCMVDEHLNVKVGDFGFTRDIYGQNYYRLNRKTRLPIKWMSPESLLDNLYTEKSDVWSFGITCWEVYSLGRLPYPGIDSADIPDYLQKGNVLRKPFLCPQEMYNIFLTCWTISPQTRPNFEQVVVVMLSSDEDTNNNNERQQDRYFVLENSLYHTFEKECTCNEVEEAI